MLDFLRNGKLLSLMLGHFTVDSYVGVIPILYPLLIGRFNLSLATVGFVSLAYGGMAAISQPPFGLLLFSAFGIHGTGWLVLPGLATGGYLLWRLRSPAKAATATVRASGLAAHVPVFALAAVIAVMMSRSWTVGTFQAFTPTWYAQQGYG